MLNPGSALMCALARLIATHSATIYIFTIKRNILEFVVYVALCLIIEMR